MFIRTQKKILKMQVFRSSVIFLVVSFVTCTASSTIIVVEDAKACFRRVLAGKRVARGLVKKSLICERTEDCQRECADERHFICEGFNYRLDPTGRGKGECELIDLPISRLDIGRDVYPDADYDYYERDRNAASVNCKGIPSGAYYPPGGGGGGYRPPGGGGYLPGFVYDRDRPDYGRRPPGEPGLRRPGDRWPDDGDRYGNRRPRPRPEFERRPDDHHYQPEYHDDWKRGDNRRGDYSYHQSHHSQNSYENSHSYHHDYHYNDGNDFLEDTHRYPGIHYLPGTHYNRPHYELPHDSYEPYQPPKIYHDRYDDRERDKNNWGLNNNNNWGLYGGSYGKHDSYYKNHKYQQTNRNRYDIDRKNYYLPSKYDKPKYWGQYGGSYGNGGGLQYNGYGYGQGFDYWGFNKYEDRYVKDRFHGYDGNLKPPFTGNGYLPLPPKSEYHNNDYLPANPLNEDRHYLPLPQKPSHSPDHFDNSILPAEPRKPNYNFLKDECSLRTAAGFKLHKAIVRKYYSVPNIYECELQCFNEKDFLCSSYAFRYTVSFNDPIHNCYLSHKSYKDLDYYTDLIPDREFDIYTMNNLGRCQQPLIIGKETSDCFWRVRSGQRLDHKIVRDSLTTKSIVECQIECLQSQRFTCRAYSFRYGSPVIGGAIDNCQLTDWPFYELDPRVHFVPEPGFEIYDRGSYGHGCEPDHFGIRGRHEKDSVTRVDQLCYIGFGSPARLLPQATRKSLSVPTELDCKAECSKSREKTLFQCMSFSYRSTGPKDRPNCDLSDILQRDLLPTVDYVLDPDAWLFAWDNYNPECIALTNEPIHNNQIDGNGDGDKRHGYDFLYPLDTWRVYSVSGWPCRRGSKCKENRQAGFWYCELEGGVNNAWDYCCRPDHQCGYSQGYPYQWCYVGPAKTQWRKCNDRYYPYIHNYIDRFDQHQSSFNKPPHNDPWFSNTLGGNFVHDIIPPPPYRPGSRPDRPTAKPTNPPPRPSLDEYEMQFEDQFLDPPKPGGFGQPRHWPVSYLHKEMPPNNTDSEPRLMRISNGKDHKYAAIQNLINAIKSDDLKNVQYHIANESSKEDDVLFVKIPLPSNFTKKSEPIRERSFGANTTVNLSPVDLDDYRTGRNRRLQKSLPLTTTLKISSNVEGSSRSRPTPVYRKSYITRTNLTSHSRPSRLLTT